MSVEEEVVEFQKLDKQFQAIMAQRMQLEAQKNDMHNALKELEKTTAKEVYKLVGGIMVKSTPEDAKKDLEHKIQLVEKGLVKFLEEENNLRDKLTRLSKKLEQFLGRQSGG